ncbi:MAG: DUF4115 domain-containing protein [Colwellia sp.]
MNENIATVKAEKVTQSSELSEDMEMISPGQMLSDAREKKGLTQEQIAATLNFRLALVINIEQDYLDQSLPATFNRGYLCNYAKLVGVNLVDIIASYDALGAAKIQRSELQSFSNLTEKQAEHSRLMWVSYLIVAILIGLTVLWWLQDNNQQAVNKAQENKAINSSLVQVKTTLPENSKEVEQALLVEKAVEKTVNKTELKHAESTLTTKSEQEQTAATIQPEDLANTDVASNRTEPLAQPSSLVEPTSLIAPAESTAIFTFSGDCWVNIYDALGERIAWGVKKTGYVMTVKGISPLKITLGRPELATIVFNDQPIDMSPFNVGNIAKFTLPIDPE